MISIKEAICQKLTGSMEELTERAGEWSLDCDKTLLEVLHDFSAGFLTSVKEVQESLDQLDRGAHDVAVRAQTAQNRFRLLAHQHFIKQVRMIHC